MTVNVGSRGRNAWIDCLRGYAVLVVCLAHARFLEPVAALDIGALDHLHAPIGVHIFYFISGFLVVRILADELGQGESETSRKALFHFWMRRLWRLQPTFLMFLLVYYLTVHDPDDALPLSTLLLPVSNWFGGPYFTWHVKTLHLEETFYILAGLLFLFVVMSARRQAVLWTILAALLILRFAYFPLAKVGLTLPAGIMTYTKAFDPIILGGLMSLNLNRVRGSRPARVVEQYPLASFLLAFAAMFVLGWLATVKPFSYPLAFGLTSLWSLCAAILVLSYLEQDGWPKNRIVHEVGMVSYTLYLFQQFPLSGRAALDTFSWTGFASVATATMVFVWVWNRTVELPLTRYGARAFPRVSGRTVSAGPPEEQVRQAP